MITATRSRWKTRRWMATMAFWVLILTLPGSAFFYWIDWIDEKFIVSMSGLAISVMGAIAAIVMTYISAATYDDVKGKREES